MAGATCDATEMPGSVETPGPELLTFLCGGRPYAIDVLCVREIRSWSEPTPLPHTPQHLRGMVNLRGSVLPVTDLSLRLGQALTEHDSRNVIIVVQLGETLHGLLVGAVSDIVRPTPDQLQDVPKVGTDDEPFAKRLLVVDDAMIQILSAATLFPPRDRAFMDHSR